MPQATEERGKEGEKCNAGAEREGQAGVAGPAAEPCTRALRAQRGRLIRGACRPLLDRSLACDWPRSDYLEIRDTHR